MKPSPTVTRIAAAGLLAVMGALPAWGQSADGRKIESPPRDATQQAPEVKRAYQRLQLQPLFPQIGIAVLQDIKELERRPEGTPGEWTEPLRRRVLSYRPGPPRDASQDRLRERMSADEWEVRSGGMQRRLISLALTGRITEEEYDRLVDRLQGN
jgi:hypothetical protein